MRKLLSLLSVLMLIILFGCEGSISGLPNYDDKECFYSDGFQDYTDYCKYTYNETSIEKFTTHRQFTQVTKSNIEIITKYFENFESWVEYTEYYEKYDFDYKQQIKIGDYYYIYEDPDYNKFGNYNVYYLDMDTQILYYIHNNT